MCAMCAGLFCIYLCPLKPQTTSNHLALLPTILSPRCREQLWKKLSKSNRLLERNRVPLESD